jgi:hypothetical protein
MRTSYFTFSVCETNDEDDVETRDITHSFTLPTDNTWDDVLPHFQDFMNGLGYRMTVHGEKGIG